MHVAFITQYSILCNFTKISFAIKEGGEVVVVVVQSVQYACSTHVYGSSSSTQEDLLLYNPKGHSTMILGGFLPFNVILSGMASCR